MFYSFSSSVSFITQEVKGAGFHAAYVALLRDTGRMTAEEVVQRHLGARSHPPTQTHTHTHHTLTPPSPLRAHGPLWWRTRRGMPEEGGLECVCVEEGGGGG